MHERMDLQFFAVYLEFLHGKLRLRTYVELTGQTDTNPSSAREEDLNPEPLDYKSSALTTRPRCLQPKKQ